MFGIGGIGCYERANCLEMKAFEIPVGEVKGAIVANFLRKKGEMFEFLIGFR